MRLMPIFLRLSAIGSAPPTPGPGSGPRCRLGVESARDLGLSELGARGIRVEESGEAGGRRRPPRSPSRCPCSGFDSRGNGSLPSEIEDPNGGAVNRVGISDAWSNRRRS